MRTRKVVLLLLIGRHIRHLSFIQSQPGQTQDIMRDQISIFVRMGEDCGSHESAVNVALTIYISIDRREHVHGIGGQTNNNKNNKQYKCVRSIRLV